MIHYEEHLKGTVHEGTNIRTRGKICWFNLETVKRDAPAYAYLFKHKPDDEGLSNLANYLVLFLKSKGVVFFDQCFYRYKVNTAGHLSEIGVNYHHIK